MTLLALAAALALVPGVYTNEEQAYFSTDSGKPVPWVGIAVDTGGAVRRVDAFGASTAGAPPSGFAATADGYDASLGGMAVQLQRGRVFTCWASVPLRALKDGKQDWWFKSGLVLHDRGGRVEAMTDEYPPQHYTLRMRNVVWPSGPNQPSLVLYVHGDDPDHAISYSWADPAAKRVGINLRTMQASCALAQ